MAPPEERHSTPSIQSVVPERAGRSSAIARHVGTTTAAATVMPRTPATRARSARSAGGMASTAAAKPSRQRDRQHESRAEADPELPAALPCDEGSDLAAGRAESPIAEQYGGVTVPVQRVISCARHGLAVTLGSRQPGEPVSRAHPAEERVDTPRASRGRSVAGAGRRSRTRAVHVCERPFDSSTTRTEPRTPTAAATTRRLRGPMSC